MEELLELLPPDAPNGVRIPQSLGFQGFPAEIDMRAHLLNDPSFGWKFIKSFLDLGRPLPALVYESDLLRPYCYLRYAKRDQDARAAIELEQPANRHRRVLLRCLLLLAESEYEAIAQRLNFSLETIRIYEALFWNLRDRDRIFIGSLVYPDSRRVEFVPDYALNEDTMNLALRAAFNDGIELVEELLGMRNPVEDLNGVEHARALAARILSTGNFMAKVGGLHQNLPALANALKLVGGGQGKERDQPRLDDDDRRGLGGMSLGRSLQETFLEIIRPDLERQLALQNSAS